MKLARVKKPAQWVIASAFLGYIGWFLWDRRGDLAGSWDMPPSRLALISGLLLVYYFVFVYRMQMVMAKYGQRKVPYFEWFQLIIVSRFINTIAPQAGNVYRALKMKQVHGVTYTNYITMGFSFTWMDTVFNFAMAVLILAILQPSMRLFGGNALAILALGGAGVLFAPYAGAAIVRALPMRNEFVARQQKRIAEMLECSIENVRDIKYTAAFFGLGLLLFGIMAAVFYLCFLSLGIKLSISSLTLFYTLYRLSLLVNITPGNLGLREWAYGVLSVQLSAGMGEGILIAAFMRALTSVVLAFLAGAIAMGQFVAKRRGRGRSDGKEE